MPEPGRKSEPTGRLFAPARLDAALAELGAGQHAVFALSQVVELGLTPRAAQKRVAASRLHRIHTTVYSLVPRRLLTREGHWMAAVLACGSGAVLSHRSAAALHGIRPSARRNIEVTVPGRSPRRRGGIDAHRARTLTAADVTVVRAIPCTSPARTMLDLADVVPRRALERAFDQAEALALFDLRALEDQLTRNATRAAAHRVRSVLEEHYIGSTPTRSELEEAFWRCAGGCDFRSPRSTSGSTSGTGSR